jgi:tetratricopeptide (TPR) repeat protein
MVEDGNTTPETGFTNVPPAAPDHSLPDESSTNPATPTEIIPPTPVVLRPERRGQAGRSRRVVAALTADALWIQDIWQLRHVPLSTLADIKELRNSRQLALMIGDGTSVERLRLTFAGAEERQFWQAELQACREKPAPNGPSAERPIPEGVTLLKQVPEMAHAVMGRVEFTAATAWLADRCIQLAAGQLGADAIVGLHRRRCPEEGPGARHVSGTAIRVEDAAVRQQLRRRWFNEAVSALAGRMLLLLIVQGILLLLAGVVCARISSFQPPTGETPVQALESMGIALALICAWPLILLALLWIVRWPPLLGSVGLAVLAATTGRGLAVVLAHLLAVQVMGADLEASKIWYFADPVDWTLIIIGLVLALRAWRLGRDAPHILPNPSRAVGTTPSVWRRGLLGVTAAYALALLGFVGFSRYQLSAEMFQPKVDWPREDEALLALNRGAALMDKEDNAEAERSLQRSLRLWEERTRKPGVSLDDQLNLGLTLYNLGLICQRTGRLDEAEHYHERVVALGDRLGEVGRNDNQFQRCLGGSRRMLEALRDDRVGRLLDEKDQQGVRKYEEAQVKVQKGEAKAEELYAEAIALWEEILPQVKVPDYRRFAVARLAAAHLILGELRQRLGKVNEAEASLLKSIEYGEKAAELEPDRPLPKHNLEVAREKLARQREQGLQQEIGRLNAAKRFADANDLWLKRITEKEDLHSLLPQDETTTRLLAYRLDQFAWFLAHCPDKRVRDTKAAVRRARRATELQPDQGDYWYTLAMVQYRNGDWKDSLASLDQLKAKEGEFEASGWFLVAMNRQQLKQVRQAREAFQMADEWIDERKRQAEDNAVLRFQYETMRPGIEALRHEAENLLSGKDPANEGVG